MWHCKTFDELNTYELFQIYKARTDVFVVEQHCPYPEVDDKDLKSLHLFCLQNNAVAACARIIPEQSAVHFGRVLVAQPARQSCLGRLLVQTVLNEITAHFPDKPIHIQAQEYLRDFYGSFGFKPVSGVYLEDGIGHVDMVLGAT